MTVLAELSNVKRAGDGVTTNDETNSAMHSDGVVVIVNEMAWAISLVMCVTSVIVSITTVAELSQPEMISTLNVAETSFKGNFVKLAVTFISWVVT